MKEDRVDLVWAMVPFRVVWQKGVKLDTRQSNVLAPFCIVAFSP